MATRTSRYQILHLGYTRLVLGDYQELTMPRHHRLTSFRLIDYPANPPDVCHYPSLIRNERSDTHPQISSRIGGACSCPKINGLNKHLQVSQVLQLRRQRTAPCAVIVLWGAECICSDDSYWCDPCNCFSPRIARRTVHRSRL